MRDQKNPNRGENERSQVEQIQDYWRSLDVCRMGLEVEARAQVHAGQRQEGGVGLAG
jgi:hypothetical protein